MKNDIIQSVSISGDFFGAEDLSVFTDSFVGCRIEDIKYGKVEISGLSLISGLTNEMILSLFSDD